MELQTPRLPTGPLLLKAQWKLTSGSGLCLKCQGSRFFHSGDMKTHLATAEHQKKTDGCVYSTDKDRETAAIMSYWYPVQCNTVFLNPVLRPRAAYTFDPSQLTCTRYLLFFLV